jgi:hypothetical protein
MQQIEMRTMQMYCMTENLTIKALDILMRLWYILASSKDTYYFAQ